jgi:hypothetical protein
MNAALRRPPRLPLVIAASIIAVLSLAPPGCAYAGRAPAGQDAGGSPAGRTAFLARVDEYMAVHAAAGQALSPVPSDATADQIDTRQRALAQRIAQKRATAAPGDVFTPDARAYIRGTLRRALAGPDGADLRDAIMDENPGRVQLRVNQRYPDGVPLSTVPYQVLAVMPPLPDELEYRFIGTRLVLLDARAHLVVDFMDDALPK